MVEARVTRNSTRHHLRPSSRCYFNQLISFSLIKDKICPPQTNALRVVEGALIDANVSRVEPCYCEQTRQFVNLHSVTLSCQLGTSSQVTACLLN